jgi:hypothetical protein
MAYATQSARFGMHGKHINRHRLSRRSAAWMLVVGISLVTACTTVTTQSFKVPPSGNADASVIANDADFGKYKKLMADDMGIFMPAQSPLPDEDVERIRQIFRRAFLDELDGYTIVDKPAPDVLMVQASLVDLRNSATTDLPELRLGVREMARPGSLLFLMELRDSETDRVLGRAADNSDKSDPISELGFATGSSATTDWDSVESAAQRWAELFRKFLDKNMGQ